MASVTVVARTREAGGVSAKRSLERTLQLPLPTGDSASSVTCALLTTLTAPAHCALELRVPAVKALRPKDVLGKHAYTSSDNLDALAGWQQPGRTKPCFDPAGLRLRVAAAAAADGRCAKVPSPHDPLCSA
jgi:hypothetical protein